MKSNPVSVMAVQLVQVRQTFTNHPELPMSATHLRNIDAALATLPVFGMTDQPPTCPKCGARITRWLAGEETAKQIVQCEPCEFVYRLEADES